MSVRSNIPMTLDEEGNWCVSNRQMRDGSISSWTPRIPIQRHNAPIDSRATLIPESRQSGYEGSSLPSMSAYFVNKIHPETTKAVKKPNSEEGLKRNLSAINATSEKASKSQAAPSSSSCCASGVQSDFKLANAKEVVICEEMKITLKDVQPTLIYLGDGWVTSYSSMVRIPPIKVDQRLLDGLKSHGVTTTLKVGDTITGFILRISGPDMNKKGVGPGYIRLTGVPAFLHKAFEADPDWIDQLKIQVTLTPLQLRCGSFKMELADLSYSFESRQDTMLFNVNMNSDAAEFWNRRWFGNSWTTAVTLKIQFPPVIKKCRAVADPHAAAGRLLCDEVLADTTVIAANKAEIKFHRYFLAVQSPVFEKMFQADTKEARTGILELPEMSEECVRALKEFLYVGDVSAPEDNSVIWFELFKAGQKYAIQSLEAIMEQIFLDMDVEWCSADVALGLFLFVKDLEFPQLKCKAVQVLKSKRKELKELPRCRKWIKEGDANVVLELMECLAQDFI